MPRTKAAGPRVVTSNRPAQRSKPSQADSTARRGAYRGSFPRLSLRRFLGWPEGLAAALEMNWKEAA